MNRTFLSVAENKQVSPSVYKMILSGDVSEIRIPGQFINIRIDGFYLRRPISVSESFNNGISILYKIAGKGTQVLSEVKAGAVLDTLCGLGNGFDITASEEKHTLLIGGGIGSAPLYWLAKELHSQGRSIQVLLGFNTVQDIFYEKEFLQLCPTIITTVDGSYGKKGFVSDLFSDLKYDYFYTCGPEPMLKAVFNATSSSGEFSFEERMGCGFGACMGCTCKTVTGWKRICKDGPVLKKEELLWAD